MAHCGWPRRWPATRCWGCCPRGTRGSCGTRPGWSRCCNGPTRPGRRATRPSSPSCSPRTPTWTTTPAACSTVTCPRGVAAAFCRDLGNRLAPPADVTLARRVFVAMTDPDVADEPALTDRLPAAFERVRGWRRRDLGILARALEDDEELAELFQDWRDEQRTGLARRLFGGGPGRPARAAGTGQGEA